VKILSGTYKGIRIETTKSASYRPTKSRVRKSIFDILSPFHYSNILDLYSGSGILGFESASRGAESVTFVENNFKNIKLLTHNKIKFNQTDFSVIKSNVEHS
jgi:N6-adenine-specific methylase